MKKNLSLFTVGLLLVIFSACAGTNQSGQDNLEQAQEIQQLDSLNNEIENVANNLKSQTEAVKQSLDSLLEDQ